MDLTTQSPVEIDTALDRKVAAKIKRDSRY